MQKIKACLAIGVAILFLTLASINPASAKQSMFKYSTTDLEEVAVFSVLSELSEKIENEAQNFEDIVDIIEEFCQNKMTDRFPIISTILKKILSFVLDRGDWYIGGRNVDLGGVFTGELLEKFKRSNPTKFIISFGTYNCLKIRDKENEFKFSKPFAFWRYSTRNAKIIRGKTTIISRTYEPTHPLDFNKKIGPQLGFMRNFRGLYLDIQSKLTGNYYTIILGRAQGARVLGLPQFC